MNISELFDFIKTSPTPYHAIDSIRRILLSRGFTELYEEDEWQLSAGQGYFVARGGSSLIAFVARTSVEGFNIAASHSDSPAFRVKYLGERLGAYSSLDTEKYGGAILYSWFDRPLGLAGRAVVSVEDGVEIRLVNPSTRLVIPSLAIHMDRSVNQSFAPNLAKEMLPLYSLEAVEGALLAEVAEALGVEADKILSEDLVLYCADEPVTVGRDSELVLSPRLDDLAAVFASLDAFISSEGSASVPVLAVFDNEEVGSETMAGAASTFLHDTLLRVVGSEERLSLVLAHSLMLSCDNAHALHPAHPDVADPKNAPLLGGGVAVKFNASHRYSTDAVSEGLLRAIADKAGIALQTYANRADLVGGSTMGSIASTKVAVNSVDIGIPQLAMHSANETCAVSDILAMQSLISAFYSSQIIKTREGYTVKK